MDDDLDQIELWLNTTKDWNGGAGVIVPKAVGDRLKALGFEEGYTVQGRLEDAPHEEPCRYCKTRDDRVHAFWCPNHDRYRS